MTIRCETWAINDIKNKRQDAFDIWCYKPDAKNKLKREKMNEEKLSLIS